MKLKLTDFNYGQLQMMCCCFAGFELNTHPVIGVMLLFISFLFLLRKHTRP
jgi:hypothetical protein